MNYLKEFKIFNESTVYEQDILNCFQDLIDDGFNIDIHRDDQGVTKYNGIFDDFTISITNINTIDFSFKNIKEVLLFAVPYIIDEFNMKLLKIGINYYDINEHKYKYHKCSDINSLIEICEMISYRSNKILITNVNVTFMDYSSNFNDDVNEKLLNESFGRLPNSVILDCFADLTDKDFIIRDNRKLLNNNGFIILIEKDENTDEFFNGSDVEETLLFAIPYLIDEYDLLLCTVRVFYTQLLENHQKVFYNLGESIEWIHDRKYLYQIVINYKR